MKLDSNEFARIVITRPSKRARRGYRLGGSCVVRVWSDAALALAYDIVSCLPVGAKVTILGHDSNVGAIPGNSDWTYTVRK